jgi:hypothetical protein
MSRARKVWEMRWRCLGMKRSVSCDYRSLVAAVLATKDVVRDRDVISLRVTKQIRQRP